jgi:hypothetical protein
MTVRGLLLALAVLASTPVPAAQGRCYSIWRYSFAQRCGVAHKQAYAAHKFVSPPEKPVEADFDIPLPFLDARDFARGEPDEVTSARLQLLGYAHAR